MKMIELSVDDKRRVLAERLSPMFDLDAAYRLSDEAIEDGFTVYSRTADYQWWRARLAFRELAAAVKDSLPGKGRS